MKITRVTPMFVDRFLLVRVETDNGVEGIGESGAWGHIEASAAAIEKFAEYLVGKDPRRIEHHWQVMFRAHHFTGAAISGAISAIDIALWDIKGKSLGVPVHDLLGGAVRDKARLYAHVKGSEIDRLASLAVELKGRGFTAFGHLNPFLDEDISNSYFKPHARKMKDAVDNVFRLREEVGPDVDLCIELHRRLTPAEAITFAHAIEPAFPMFIEDPIPPEGIDAMAALASRIRLPIATGERFFGVHQFHMLLSRAHIQFLRPCVCLCGGITGGRKVAALAEVHETQIVPHNPLSPISLAACLQLSASVANFAIQEYPIANPELEGHSELRARSIVKGLPEPDSGFIRIPDGPGLGIELLPNVERDFPRKHRPIRMRPHVDGFVVDQ